MAYSDHPVIAEAKSLYGEENFSKEQMVQTFAHLSPAGRVTMDCPQP
jgi:hypothetical protein